MDDIEGLQARYPVFRWVVKTAHIPVWWGEVLSSNSISIQVCRAQHPEEDQKQMVVRFCVNGQYSTFYFDDSPADEAVSKGFLKLAEHYATLAQTMRNFA